MNLRYLVCSILLFPFTTHAEEIVYAWVGPSSSLLESIQLKAQSDARADILANNLKVVFTGLPVTDNQRAELLKKYHVIESSMGCIPSIETEAYEAEYNKIIEAEIEKRYGGDFWERVEMEWRAVADKKKAGAG